jgi:predicted protein tyrosine phosphatase
MQSNRFAVLRILRSLAPAQYDRSPTAEAIYKRDSRFLVKSCGTKADAKVCVSQELLDWADKVIVFMPMHKSYILRRFKVHRSRITVLHIRDIYDRMDPRLVSLIRERTSRSYGLQT